MKLNKRLKKMLLMDMVNSKDKKVMNGVKIKTGDFYFYIILI